MQTRRELFRQAGRVFTSMTAISLIPESWLKVGHTAYAGVKSYSDLNVRSAAGTASPLTAAALASGQSFTGKITEGNHTHSYTVSPEQLAQINAGHVVTLTSSQGSDGSVPHRVTIDPARLLAGGSTVQVFESEHGELLAIRLGQGAQPYFYVEGSEGLNPESVKACLGTIAACQSEAAFSQMQLVKEISDRQIFGSVQRVQLTEESYLKVWATSQSGKTAKIVAKITK